MRIIQVVNVRWFNATAWYALYLSKLLQEAGYRVAVLTLEGTESHEHAVKMGLKNIIPMNLNTVSPVGVARLYRDMHRLVKDFRPDIVNCHRGEGFILWGLLKLQTGGFRLVRTRGDQRLPKNNLPNRWLHGIVADAVVATNSVMAGHFRTEMGLPEKHLWQILGGVDTGKFHFDAEGRARVRQEFGYADDDIVLGMVGRFDGVKNQHDFIRAVGEIYTRRGRKNVKILFVGFETETSEAEVRSWCRQYGVDAITRITGMRSDVAACVSALDIGVSASLFSETIARAPMEIMACERPLIATDTGVLPDITPPEGLVPRGDWSALADKLDQAVSDAEFLKELTEKEQIIMSQYSGQDFLKQTLALYEGLIKG